MNNQIRTNMWKWWCGGGVIAIAVVLGCASAVEFRAGDQTRTAEPTIQKKRLTDVPEVGREPAHNGGKVRMPVTVAFAVNQDSTIVMSSQKVVEIALSADADITQLSGEVIGIDGLEGLVRQPLSFNEIRAGETKRLRISVPAKTGALAVQVAGVVGGSVPMSASLQLQVVNPSEPAESTAPALGNGVGAQSVHGKVMKGGISDSISRDSEGRTVQPLRATEE